MRAGVKRRDIARSGAFGLEQADENATHLRAVIQFYVGQPLFDWFFNATTGYRAQFRIGWQNGLARNEALIQMLRQPLEAIADRKISIWRSPGLRRSRLRASDNRPDCSIA